MYISSLKYYKQYDVKLIEMYKKVKSIGLKMMMERVYQNGHQPMYS